MSNYIYIYDHRIYDAEHYARAGDNLDKIMETAAQRGYAFVRDEGVLLDIAEYRRLGGKDSFLALGQSAVVDFHNRFGGSRVWKAQYVYVGSADPDCMADAYPEYAAAKRRDATAPSSPHP